MATANTDEMKRFAFDVFVYTMSRFNTRTNISPSKCRENTYEHSDFLFVLSRGYISYQLKRRDTWKPNFEAKFKSNGLKKFKDISELLEEVWEKMNSKPRRQINPMRRTIVSLAVINDLIQFLYSKNCRLFLNKLAGLWRNYFACFEDEFEKAGGLSHLYSFHNNSFPIFDEIIDYFIPNWGFPYGRKDFSVSFMMICVNPSYMHLLKKVVHDAESDIKALASNVEEKLAIAPRSPRRSGDKETEVFENTGLGIRPHEELLQETYSLYADKGTTAEKPVASSIEEASATARADVKLHRKQFGQTSREQVKEHRHPSIEITSPDGRSKDRGGLPGSPLSPEGRSKDRGALTSSPLSPEGQSKGRGALDGSPSSPQEQKHRRGSPRTPEGISRLEQKRQKHRQPKKTEPTN